MVKVTPEAEYVSEYVELYFKLAGHQRVNLLPEEARELCKELFLKGYGPDVLEGPDDEGKVLVRMTLAKWRELMEHEPGAGWQLKQQQFSGWPKGQASSFQDVERLVHAARRKDMVEYIRDLANHKLGTENQQRPVDECARTHDTLRAQLLREIQDGRDVLHKYLEEHLQAGLDRMAARISQVRDSLLPELMDYVDEELRKRKLVVPKNSKLPAFTPVLKYGCGEWMDSNSRNWACHKVVARYAPWLHPSDTIQLKAYSEPGSRVRVAALSHSDIRNDQGYMHPIKVDDQVMDSHASFYNWLKGLSFKPAWLGVHTVTDHRKR